MPAPSPDLAAHVSGGSSSGSTSLMKGMLADLPQARTGSTESGVAEDSDFESMLDNPAANPETTDGSTTQDSHSFGRCLRNGLSGTGGAESGRCVLSAELSAVATGTLQIKGVLSRLKTQDQATVTALPPASSAQGETVAVTGPVELPADATAIPLSEILVPPTTNQAKPVAHSRFSHLMGRCSKGVAATVDKNGTIIATAEVKPDKPKTDDAILSNPTATVAPAEVDLESLIAAAQPVLSTVNPPAQNIHLFSPEIIREDVVAEHADGDVTPQLLTETVGDSRNEQPITPSDKASSTPVETRLGALSSHVASAKGLRGQTLFLRSAVERQHFAVETIRGVTVAQLPATVITAEQRRELIATVAGLLAPLCPALPGILPSTTATTSGATTAAEAILGEGGGNPLSTVVTIKLAGQTPITLELPYTNITLADASAGLHESASTVSEDRVEASTGQAPIKSDDHWDTGIHSEVGMANPVEAQVQQSALNSDLPDPASMDFRIQLAAKIESAWAEAEVSPASVPSEVEPPSLNPLAVEQEYVAPINDGSHTVATAPVAPIELLIEMPGFGSSAAEIVAAQPVVELSAKKRIARFERAEKTAGDSKSISSLDKAGNILSEKTFLTATVQGLKSRPGEAGTDVANSGDNMPAPFTSRRLSVDALEIPPRFNLRGDLLQGVNDSPRFGVPAEMTESATPEPVLAHRAVETIMNVVDAQRHGSANASSVNLHFKFGGDDLAVRVQMRGGEVLTQFLTDSAELRSAIATEWQIMAGQGGAAGLRLLEPSILPASAGASSGFGSASHGQSNTHQQQQTHQQQAQAAAAFNELRGLRRGTPLMAPAKEIAPRISIVQPTSQHLTALA
jgi:hypothetical protein